MEQYLSGQNQLHIFDNDNFSIIPKSFFSDNDNLPISSKNAEISAVDNFFNNMAHPYLWVSESVCQASVTPDQISTFSNIYRHTSTLLTQYNI